MYYDLKDSGKRIATLRKKRGLTQEQLAQQFNISVSLMGKIEIGSKGVSVDLLIEMSEFFNVSLDYIVLGRQVGLEHLKQLLDTIIQMLIDFRNKL